MRLDKLELRAFGPFAEQSLAFERQDPDFHLVLGPNEAGKSTALAAITCALYGFPQRRTYDYLHGEPRAGLTLSNGGETLSFVRRRGRKNTIRDSADRDLVPDSALEAYLGGVSQDDFLSYFGLSHESLRAGGDEVLRSGGYAGQAIFAAAASVAGLHEVRAELEEKAAELLRPRASSVRLRVLRREYEERRAAIEQAALSVNDWTRVTNELNELRKRRNALREHIATTKAEQERLDRIRNALPYLGVRRQHIESLAQISDAPLLSDDFGERRTGAEGALDAARSAGARERQRLERLDGEIEALAVDESILEEAAAIAALAELASQQHKAEADAEGLRRELAGYEAQAARLAEDIRPGSEAAALAQLQFSAADRERFQELAREAADQAQERKRLERDAAGLERERAALAEQLAGLRGLASPAPLRAALTQARRQGDLEAKARSDRGAAEAARAEAKAGIEALGLWTGGPDELAALPVPDIAVARRYEAAWGDFENRSAQLRDQLRETDAESDAIRVKLSAFGEGAGTASEHALAERRQARERGWRLVLSAWRSAQPPSAVSDLEADAFQAEIGELDLPRAYEAAVRRADETADRLRLEADRVAEAGALKSQLAGQSDKRQRLEAELTETAEAWDNLKAQWSQLWEPAGIDAGPPVEAIPWLERRRDLAEQARNLRELDRTARESAASLEAHRSHLAECLEPLGETGPFDDAPWHGLIELAGDCLERLNENLKERDSLQTRLDRLDEEELPALQDELRLAGQAEARWRAAWSELCQRVQVPADSGPAVVHAVLDSLKDLRNAEDRAAERRLRLEQIASDSARFVEKIRAVCASAAPDLADAPPFEAAAELQRRLQAAVTAEARRTELDRQRDEAREAIEEAGAQVNEAAAALERLCAEAGCASPEGLPAAQARSAERKELEAALREAEAQVMHYSAGKRLEAFVAEAEQEPADTLGARIDELQSQIRAGETEAQEVSETIGGKEGELAGMDGSEEAAAAAQRAEQTLSAMRDEAGQYLRLRVAAYALQQGMERYRRERQGPILEQASRHFEALTLGSFSGLEADLDEEGQPKLAAVRPGTPARRLGVDALSDGTLDQLYLALRLAVHVQENRPALPFIVDDILVNFDDERSAAALRVLAGLAERTQVIFFTHHQHLVELACDALPGALPAIHALPGPLNRPG